MNKASCLSLVSNAILYWNTLKITDIVDQRRQQGEGIEDETLAHVSLLPFKHVLPNGTYFNDDYPRAFSQIRYGSTSWTPPETVGFCSNAPAGPKWEENALF